jgi:uncharacterized damage-inducible protein DinB
MADKTKWIDRKFEYHPPQGEYPCILARLRGTPARVEEIAKSLPGEMLTKRLGESWSIQEQIGHLEDVEELLSARIDDFIAGRTTLRPADMSNTRTVARRHNEKDIDAMLASFRAVRMGIVARLDALDDEIIAREALHPRLKKPMRVVDMVFFFAEHDDHHIATMIALAKKLSPSL